MGIGYGIGSGSASAVRAPATRLAASLIRYSIFDIQCSGFRSFALLENLGAMEVYSSSVSG